MARLSKKDEQLLKAVQKQTASKGHESAHTDSTVGIGVDLLEIERMERAIERTPRILQRVFTSNEREYAWSKTKPALHYASFFAAREAVLKALGCGFNGVGFQEVEIVHDEKGKPEVVLHGNAEALAREQGIVEIQISLSHTHTMVVASAVLIKATSSPRKVEVLSPLEELARQFKELRSLLDGLGVDTTDAEMTRENLSQGLSDQMSLNLDSSEEDD